MDFSLHHLHISQDEVGILTFALSHSEFFHSMKNAANA